LHIVPIGYRLDERASIDNPVGFSGKLIRGDYFIIDADKYYLKDLVDLCNESGLQVKRLYSEPFASASVTVSDDYKNVGCAMADIGGGTTDVLVFQNGRPFHSFTVNIAGKLMTNDISVGLNLNYLEAEKLKIRFGLSPRSLKETVECTNIAGQTKMYRPEHTLPILAARLQELGAHLSLHLKAFRGNLGGGLILTGGGSEVRGIQAFYHRRMGIPVHKSKPDVSGAYSFILNTDQLSGANISHPTRHATMLGLLNLEIGKIQEQMASRSASWSSRYLGQFVNWIKELS
jgi:cell division protein FtsA